MRWSSGAQLACVVLLLFAGCIGTGEVTQPASPTVEESATAAAASSSSEEDRTAEPTTTESAARSYEFPAGTSNRTIENVSLLFAAHKDQLSETGYRMRYEYTGPSDLRKPTSSPRVNSTWVIRSNITTNRWIETETTIYPDGSRTNSTEYVDAGVIYAKRGGARADGSPHEPYYYVDRRWTDDSFLRFHIGFMRTIQRYHLPVFHKFFTENDPQRTATKHRGNRTYHVYTVDSQATGGVTDGQLVVREDGLITKLRISTRISGEHVSLTRTFRVQGPVSVATPPWKQTAIRRDNRQRGGGGECGTNDGDPTYDEDNDRDNDGLCDES